MNTAKYTRNYYMPPQVDMSWTGQEYVTKPPIWCSVDLRDGNQALVTPMSLEEKIEFYQELINIGFKQIEVGFPAASETEFRFLRTLVERKLIPEDVSIQVLTQARPHIIERTFEALEGVEKAIVHVYNSTSVAQRQQVFGKSKEEIKEIAVAGAKLLKQYTEAAGKSYQFEYSPESFTGTEPEYALEVCNAVLDIWQPTAANKVIINLPSTVQLSMPHIYAAQISYISRNLNYRDNVILSIHPHNDRGCGVAEAEMGILAGADRVEGTLFGNGERTGNVDIVTLGLNMLALGVDPGLDFSNLPKLIELYERVTRMQVYERQPYAGKLVFVAFSGSHQDAIAKGMKWQQQGNSDYWDVPYLYIDPRDIGRCYEGDVIRINSQSGKGGVGYIMEQHYGIDLPKLMREDFSYRIKNISDNAHKELLPEEIYDAFMRQYVDIEAPLAVEDFSFRRQGKAQRVCGEVTLRYQGATITTTTEGNGRFDAICRAIEQRYGLSCANLTYSEHALDIGSTSRAIAYVSIESLEGRRYWGAGIDTDIATASVKALISAVNRLWLS